ncbi:hypothetical protein [Parasphingopyxis sp.]|uniref:TetR/AcrR family transcriptional regulator n=1 Tax=Parasphingopyxis sp. TaxID=1920299 RepID=UPI00261DBCE5|nr:hypothetical protein [Parasphingopyxis sp.]
MLDAESSIAPRGSVEPVVDWRSRRREIVERVTGVYLEKPWQSITIEAVAERSGMSFWQVYYSFDGQEDVYRAVAGRLIANIEAQIDTAPQCADTVRDTIAQYIGWLSALFLSVDYRNLAFLKLRDGPSEPWLVINIRRRIRHRLRKALESRIAGAGGKHGLSIICDSEAINRALAVLEANTAFASLASEAKVEDRSVDMAKAVAVSEIWQAARTTESAIYA